MDQMIHYYFNWQLMRQSMPLMLEGLVVTLAVASFVIFFGLLSAFALTFLRASGGRFARSLVVSFVDVFRALPALTVIVVIYFSFPYLELPLSPFWTTVLSLSCIMAAFGSEALWAAFASVPEGQFDAARSLGLRRWKVLWVVVMPQATRHALPSLTNRAISVTKGTALGSVISVPELMSQGMSIQSITGNPSVLTLAALLYLAVFAPLIALSRYVDRRFGGRT